MKILTFKKIKNNKSLLQARVFVCPQKIMDGHKVARPSRP
jgi:hypothetical protein